MENFEVLQISKFHGKILYAFNFVAEFPRRSSTEELLQICCSIHGMHLIFETTQFLPQAWCLSCLTALQDDFSITDYTVNGPKAFFANMPLSKTLTMNLDVPEPWLVEPVVAVYASSSILTF